MPAHEQSIHAMSHYMRKANTHEKPTHTKANVLHQTRRYEWAQATYLHVVHAYQRDIGRRMPRIDCSAHITRMGLSTDASYDRVWVLSAHHTHGAQSNHTDEASKQNTAIRTAQLSGLHNAEASQASLSMARPSSLMACCMIIKPRVMSPLKSLCFIIDGHSTIRVLSRQTEHNPHVIATAKAQSNSHGTIHAP